MSQPTLREINLRYYRGEISLDEYMEWEKRLTTPYDLEVAIRVAKEEVARKRSAEEPASEQPSEEMH